MDSTVVSASPVWRVPPSVRDAAHRTLLAALDQSVARSVSAAAERELNAFEERQPDVFLSTLLGVVNWSEADATARWLAAVCAKNAFVRLWRRRAHGNLGEEERAVVRQLVWDGVQVRDVGIAAQIGLLLGQLARLDYPQEWPDLVQRLLAAVQTSEGDRLLRWLQALNQVVKALAVRRTVQSRAQFADLSEPVLATVVPLWRACIERPPASGRYRLEDAQRAALLNETFKVARRMLAHGVQDLDAVPGGAAFLDALTAASLKTPPPLASEMVPRWMYLSAKTWYGCFERRRDIPGLLERFLLPWTNIALRRLLTVDDVAASTDEDEPADAVHRMRFLRDLAYDVKQVADEQVEGDSTTKGTYPPSPALTATASPELWQRVADTLHGAAEPLIQALLQRFIALREDELELLQSDPEELLRVEEDGEWDEELPRSVAEQLVQALVSCWPDHLTPFLLQVAAARAAANDWLQGDAAYRAIGRCAFEVYDWVDVRQWLTPWLEGVLSVSATVLPQRVIQARVVILLSQFVQQIGRAERQQLYPVLVRLLQDANDVQALFVALSAARALAAFVADLEFYEEDYAPHLEVTLQAVFALIGQRAQETETRLRLLDLASLLLERCGQCEYLLEAPAADNSCRGNGADGDGIAHLLHLLRDLFGMSAADGGDHLVRCQVAALMCRMLAAGGSELQRRRPESPQLALSMVAYATAPEHGAMVYLLEDALELWSCVMQYAPEYTPDMHALFQRVPTVLAHGECLQQVLALIVAYAAVGGAVWWQAYGASVAACLAQLLDADLRDRALTAIADVVAVLLRDLTAAVGGECARVLAPVLDRMSAALCGDGTAVAARSTRAAYAVCVARALFPRPPPDERLIAAYVDAAPVIFSTVNRKALALQCAMYYASAPMADVQRYQRAMALVQEVVQEEREEVEVGAGCAAGEEERRLFTANVDGNGHTGETAAETAPRSWSVNAENDSIARADLGHWAALAAQRGAELPGGAPT